MTPANRNLVERLFEEGQLPVLCTTTTLAMGVNLPAHLVRLQRFKLPMPVPSLSRCSALSAANVDGG